MFLFYCTMAKLKKVTKKGQKRRKKGQKDIGHNRIYKKYYGVSLYFLYYNIVVRVLLSVCPFFTKR